MKINILSEGRALRLSAAIAALSIPAVAQFSFNSPSSYRCGTDPHDIAVADFNGDGNLDMATTLHNPARVSILTQNDDGTFDPPAFTVIPAFTVVRGGRNAVVPQGLLAVDWDGNGRPDLVVASQASGELVFLRNLGDGAWELTTKVQVGLDPTELVASDFDGDGDIDVAVSNTVGNTISIVHNLGRDRFLQVQDITVRAGPKALAVGRFFGDNLPGIAVAVHDAHSVYVLRNWGNGYFNVETVLTVPNGTYPECVAVADFDLNGSDDIVATFSQGAANEFAVFYQMKSGTAAEINRLFTDPDTFDVGGVHPSHIVAADFDLDTRADIAVLSSKSSNLSLFCNVADHKFSFQTSMDLPGPQPSRMVVADMNRDYAPDVVCTNNGGNSLSVVLNARTNPSTYCKALPNSTGSGTSLWISGSTSIAANNFTLRAGKAPPGQLGIFLYGQKPAQTPFQGSVLCIEPPLGRLDPQVRIDATGVASFALSLAPGLVGHQMLYVLPGSVWNFQFLYRDIRGWQSPNLSAAMRIVFQP